MKIKKNERLPQLDVFRALAILAVLNVHASSFAAGVQALDSPIYYVYNFMNIFFKYGTPSFIFLSGFVLFYNYYERPVNIRLVSSFYRQRLKYIVLPYTIASFCYFLVNQYINQRLIGVPYSELGIRFGNAWLTGTAHTHLYFVFISIQFYILFPLILKLLQSKQWIVKWAIPLALVLQWGFVFINKYSLQVPNKGSYAITYLVYYMMGAYIAINFSRIKSWLLNPWDLLTRRQKYWTVMLWSTWLMAAFIEIQLWHDMRSTGNSVNTLWYELIWNVHSMLSSIVLLHAGFLIYRKASRRVVAFLTRMGGLSFGIYLLHPIILTLYRRFRYNIDPESIGYLLFIIGSLLVALFLSWAIIHVCFKRIPWSWVFLGKDPDTVSPKAKSPDIHGVNQRNGLDS
ncbi:acyltransferase [Paenibacillus sp. FA6]|uniref:acyltransferase n=1 Tax=Paenibacillus sp. FA6 TaxID=3413029 RepID=UPI003F6598C4